MQITLEVPEDIARTLASETAPLGRVALESLAAEGYRSGLLSESQVGRRAPCYTDDPLLNSETAWRAS